MPPRRRSKLRCLSTDLLQHCFAKALGAKPGYGRLLWLGAVSRRWADALTQFLTLSLQRTRASLESAEAKALLRAEQLVREQIAGSVRYLDQFSLEEALRLRRPPEAVLEVQLQ